MNLAIFDLDGTLIEINPLDDEAFVAAFRDELGIDCATVDWSQFKVVTNAGIAGELLEQVSEEHRADALVRVRRRFFELLASGCSDAASPFRAIPGAREVVEKLQQSAWRSVIATGCWRPSVELKLRSSRLPATLPFVCSDDETTREGIVRRAVALATAEHGEFDRVVMIGDAVWDVRTAIALDLPFVGVAQDERALRSHGATAIVPDFTNLDRVMHALESATVPRAV